METTKKEFHKDILITAMEGGINYWCATRKYEPENILARITEMDDDGSYGNTFTINEKIITTGINRIISGETKHELNIDFRKMITAANRFNDACDIDSEIADVIIQIGLFNEVVYG